MKSRRLIWGFVAAASVVALSAASASRAEEKKHLSAGQTKAIPCMGCHAIPGYSNVYPTYHVPKVGGQHAEYIIAALKAYRSGERHHPTMQAQASTLSDEDIADIAAFFATKKP
ncbi:MAG: cytochrome c [Gammaproteobacteria bacterium]|nr:cytochrome c [Gammaproteobacteria bacterium]